MNYKNRLEEYLTQKNNKTIKEKSFSRAEIDESLMYSITNKSQGLSLVNKTLERNKPDFTESLGIEISNYKRLVDNCLNMDTLENNNKNYNLKNFLPSFDNGSKLIKKYEHLLPNNSANVNKRRGQREIHSVEYEDKRRSNSNSPMKLEELANNHKNYKKVTVTNTNTNINILPVKKNEKIKKHFFNLYIEKLKDSDSDLDSDSDVICDLDNEYENEKDEIKIINNNLLKEKLNKKLNENNQGREEDYHWHCLDYKENFEGVNNIAIKFYNFEI